MIKHKCKICNKGHRTQDHKYFEKLKVSDGQFHLIEKYNHSQQRGVAETELTPTESNLVGKRVRPADTNNETFIGGYHNWKSDKWTNDKKAKS